MANGMEHDNELKQSGLKNTKQRTAVLDFLEHHDGPISAEQVFVELKQRDLSVNLSTVYRILETLANKGIITKLYIVGDTKALFEYKRIMHRHYLVCLGCRKIIAIDNCPLEAYEKSLEKSTNYSIAGHRLDIYGYCPECRKKNCNEAIQL
ncbi:MAG: transcriptional repressor [Synergistaceae bacterium]|nr:transcriptional repressor [Synergistaceae bacterium]